MDTCKVVRKCYNLYGVAGLMFICKVARNCYNLYGVPDVWAFVKFVRKCSVAQVTPYFFIPPLFFFSGYKIFIGGFMLHDIYCNM